MNSAGDRPHAPESSSPKLEWRVEWKFKGGKGKRHQMKSKVFQNEKVARSRFDYIKSLDPDEYVCCSGYSCGCGGVTNGEQWGYVEYVGIRCREVGEWQRPA